jgi:Sap, sulfolipid-1-addressing protein
MNLAVLPLAITMMAGPQIMSALIFITAKRAVAVSFAFVVGVAVAATVGVTITTWLARHIPIGARVGSPDSSVGKIIEYGLVALLIAMAIHNWVGRATIEPPKWLGTVMAAGPGKAFVTGLLLIGLFPSDVVVMLTVGVDLARSGLQLTAALPFISATVLIAALPLLAYLLFRRRAENAMPKVQDWMNDHSWLINIIVCVLFAALLLF